MGRMSELAIEREGVLDMMTSKELCEELKQRLIAGDTRQVENFDYHCDCHNLLSAITNYLAWEKKHVVLDKKSSMEKEA